MSISPTALSIVHPVAVTPAMLVATNIAETDFPAWAVGTTYTLGQRVIVLSNSRVYESLQNSNVGRDPLTATTWWIEVGPTNRWRCFDRSVTSQTVAAGTGTTTISYTLRPGQAVTALAALNVTNATSMRVRLVDATHGTVYDRTFSFASQPLQSGWWNWFFGQRQQPTQQITTDMPGTFNNADLLVDFVGGTGMGVGALVFGSQMRFGIGLQYGARVGIQDYSRKETNAFGDVILVRRAFAKRANFDLFISNNELDSLQNFLSSIRAVPCLWIGADRYESTILYGFYKNFDVLIAYPEHGECSLEIEGLT